MKISRKYLFESIEVILYAGIMVILLYLLFWPLRVDGSSMESTLFSEDRIIVSRTLSLFPLSRNDIVVCNIHNAYGSTAIIKRIIALPLEHLEIINGVIYINGEQIDQSYAQNIVRDNLSIVLGEDEYFIMGDNRSVSKDSRHIGPVNRIDIIARVLFR